MIIISSSAHLVNVYKSDIVHSLHSPLPIVDVVLHAHQTPLIATMR